MKTVIVTGGAGFIGSHLCEALVRAGHRVISLDNYFSGTRENHISGAEYVEGHTKDIEHLVREKPDLVFHLGEYSRVERSFNDMERVFDLNIHGTFRVLEFCRKQGCKIVYAGSSTKFSLPAPARAGGQAGDGGAGRDQSPYAWTKAANTDLVRNYGSWFGVPFAITYFYNVYGSREISQGPHATVIGIFKEKFLCGEPLPVVAPGTQRRNFTHVHDIVDGLLRVGEHGVGDGFGLGAPEDYSIREVADMFGKAVTMLPPRQGNRMAGVLDTKRATDELGWKPTHRLKDYIREIVASKNS